LNRGLGIDGIRRRSGRVGNKDLHV
jgi:hypothetical protein